MHSSINYMNPDQFENNSKSAS
ncbi:hypothetical protein [Thermohalobacter berrensis]